jgi:hypothetical protein
MFDEIFKKVGRYEASMWGAYLIDYEVLDDSNTNPTVRFYAVEDTEKFYFDLKFLEVGKIYGEIK